MWSVTLEEPESQSRELGAGHVARGGCPLHDHLPHPGPSVPPVQSRPGPGCSRVPRRGRAGGPGSAPVRVQDGEKRAPHANDREVISAADQSEGRAAADGDVSPGGQRAASEGCRAQFPYGAPDAGERKPTGLATHGWAPRSCAPVGATLSPSSSWAGALVPEPRAGPGMGGWASARGVWSGPPAKKNDTCTARRLPVLFWHCSRRSANANSVHSQNNLLR